MSTVEESTGQAAGNGLDERALPQRSLLRRLSSTTAFYIFAVDIVLIAVFTLASSNHVFWSLQNAQALMGNGAEALLLASGVTMMLAAGVFDLSLGANLILASVVGALLLAHLTNSRTVHAPAWAILLTLAVCLLIGAFVGLVNGLLITFVRINSLIATLGMLGICTGFAYVIAHGSDITGVATNIQSGFGLSTILKIPYPALVAVVILLALWLVLRYTRYGARTLAIGSNLTSAERAGLKVRTHLISLTMIGGALAGLAGFVDVSRFDTTNTSGHALDALAALTAAVVGGTALQGGRATMFGTLWGAVLAYVILDGLVVVGVSSFYQEIATGFVLWIAVGIDSARYRRRE
ncbi:MAG: ABC transporter permease [Streptosporangiaceae bacterium]|jgi:ribose transport system permease protein